MPETTSQFALKLLDLTAPIATNDSGALPTTTQLRPRSATNDLAVHPVPEYLLLTAKNLQGRPPKGIGSLWSALAFVWALPWLPWNFIKLHQL